jgi:hypothetical protein
VEPPPAPDAPPLASHDALEDERIVEVVCREGWGALEPSGKYEKQDIEHITIHHSGVAFTDNDKILGKLRSMQKYHMGKKKGFVDISYHFIVDLEGRVYEGRPTWARGETQTDYDTDGHLLICVVGNYDDQVPGEAQIESLSLLCAWAMQEFDLPAGAIAGHRDHAHTACPGKNLQAVVSSGEVGDRAEELIGESLVKMEPSCP